ncbi:hypothetical protein Btru_047526 [Bulinus truncatus]|nr:hypothetical protein Btru_047526 [Bulinus truncatus]
MRHTVYYSVIEFKIQLFSCHYSYFFNGKLFIGLNNSIAGLERLDWTINISYSMGCLITKNITISVFRVSMALYICFTLCMLFIIANGDERAEDTFFVKPGAGTLSVQTELKNYFCKFTYTAQGGTHEEWALSLEILDGGNSVMCTVERGIPSYLFFQDFKMELIGPLVSITDVDVKNSQRDGLSLQKDEYKLDKNSISSVPGKFKNHLEKVAVFSPLSHVDL